MTLDLFDGQHTSTPIDATYDVVVVGTGPAGAAVGRTLARGGAKVAFIEEGPVVEPRDYPPDAFGAMAKMYRAMGASVTMGNGPMPYIQGRVVGGTSVINGAISWRIPDDVHQSWLAADPALEETLHKERLERVTDQVEADLNIHPTDPAVAGPNNTLLAKGAEALGLAHRPISRNVKGCEGLGRCLQGCPEGHKMSMDRAYLPDACEHGAVIYSATRATHIITRGKKAIGVKGETGSGHTVTLRARRAVVLAASAVQTPGLLARSGIRQGPVGRNFQCHPGVALAGRFPESVRMWTGATQGHEVIGLRERGIKFEALGYDMALAAARVKGIGRALSDGIADLGHYAHWGVALKAKSRGVVNRWGGVMFSLSPEDMQTLRWGVSVLGELMLAAGADFVTPGIHGWHERVSDRATMARFAHEGPLDPKAYTMAVTHMFGTTRMGSDPRASVVRPDFRHHHVDRLYVADSSVSPTNTGVNPQTGIIAMATLCAEGMLR